MKITTSQFLNEINSRGQYRKVTAEPIPKGYLSSVNLAKKYSIPLRNLQMKLVVELRNGNVLFVQKRVKTSPISIRKIYLYKFKDAKTEKAFKSGIKG
jgi:hypothetical protein